MTDEREMRVGADGWTTIDISEALERRGKDVRCPECHGRVQPHLEYSDGTRAHFEHLMVHSSCSTKPRTINGVRTPHPESLD